jgi:uncharacterized membrane protein AbrB (regulator of aidB expression)
MSVFALRAGLTLALAMAAAGVCLWLRTPIPWMIGPLLATSLASILGAPTRSAGALRNAGQWVIGSALGLYFTPQVTALVASLWWGDRARHRLGAGPGLGLRRLALPPTWAIDRGR